jgi:bifunctional DNase/RNase
MWPHLTVDQQLLLWSVVAILLSPLIALEIQKRLDEHRTRRDRKHDLFRRLMTTRATDISPAHVEALNSIEVEFYAKDGPDKKVLDAWRIYINHVNSNMGDGDALGRWVDRRRELLVDLIYGVGQNLGYDIDKVTIKNNVYYPRGHAEVETELHALRKAQLKVFSGEAPIRTAILGAVEVIPPLPPPDGLVLPEEK